MLAAPAQTAWLPSAGLGEARATLHEFERFEEISEATLRWSDERKGTRGKPQKCLAMIYRCTETGAERRWGLL